MKITPQISPVMNELKNGDLAENEFSSATVVCPFFFSFSLISFGFGASSLTSTGFGAVLFDGFDGPLVVFPPAGAGGGAKAFGGMYYPFWITTKPPWISSVRLIVKSLAVFVFFVGIIHNSSNKLYILTAKRSDD